MSVVSGDSIEERPYGTGDRVFFLGASKTYPNGDKVSHGQACEVVGPARSEKYLGRGIEVNVPGCQNHKNFYLTEVSREAPGPLPGGYDLGDQLFYLGANKEYPDGDKIGHGQVCEVVGPAREEKYLGRGLEVRIEGNKYNSAFLLTELSPEEPGPLPGDYVLGQQVFYLGTSKTFSNGDQLVYGQEGKVLGPATDDKYLGRALVVQIQGHDQNKTLLLTDLSSEVPGLLPGGYAVGQQVFYLGASKTYSDGDKVLHGQSCEVVGPARHEEDRDRAINVQIPGNRLISTLLLTDVSSEHPGPLPGNYSLGEEVYFLGASKTYPNGDRLVHGQPCEVVGRARSGQLAGNGLEVRIKDHKNNKAFSLALLSSVPPGPLPGEYELGEQVYYLGPSRTYSNGDKVWHGQAAEVVGPARSEACSGSGLEVQIEGHEQNKTWSLTNVSRAPPGPLPGEYRLGDVVYYLGASKTYSDGDRIEHGQVCEVVGPARDEQYEGRGLEVHIEGNRYNSTFLLVDLSLEEPGPLPGSYRLYEQVFYLGTSKTFSNGDKLVYGQKGEVVGPATDEKYSGRALKVEFHGHEQNKTILLTDLSSETPEPLPDGYAVGQRVYFLGSSKEYSDGDKVVHGQACEVLGPARDKEFRGKAITVQVPGNKLISTFMLTDVSAVEPGPLPGGHQLGDRLFFKGFDKSYSNGDKVVRGQEVEVVGPARDEKYNGNGLEVKIEGHRQNKAFSLNDLSCDRP